MVDGLCSLVGRIPRLIQCWPIYSVVSFNFLFKRSTFLSKYIDENFHTRRVYPGLPRKSRFVTVLLYFMAGITSLSMVSGENRLLLKSKTLRYSSVSKNREKERAVYSPNLLYLRWNSLRPIAPVSFFVPLKLAIHLCCSLISAWHLSIFPNMLPATSPIELYEKSIFCRVGHPESPGEINETNSGEIFIRLKEILLRL